MSTIVVVKKNGYAAIAADSMTNAGSSRESAVYVVNHQKIIKVGGSYIALAGSSSLKQILNQYFSSMKSKPSLNNIDNILSIWLELHKTLKRDYFMNVIEADAEAFESSQADAVIANRYGIFGVSSYRTVQEFSKFYSYGQGSDYAMGAMYAVYDDPSLTAEDVARIGINAAAEFDKATGLPLISYALKLERSVRSR